MCNWGVDFFLVFNGAGRARFMRPDAETTLRNALLTGQPRVAIGVRRLTTSAEDLPQATAGVRTWAHPSPPSPNADTAHAFIRKALADLAQPGAHTRPVRA